MKLERRKFLAQSFLVGLGLTTVTNATPENQSSIDTCLAKPSPADALDFYLL